MLENCNALEMLENALDALSLKNASLVTQGICFTKLCKYFIDNKKISFPLSLYV